MLLRGCLVLVGLCAVGIGGAASDVPAEPLSMDVQVPLLLKTLSYDRNLQCSSDSSSAIRIGALYRPDLPGSQRSFHEFDLALRVMAGTSVKNLPVKLVPIPVPTGTLDMADRLDPTLDVLYIMEGFGTEIDRITRWSRRNSIMTMSGSATWASLGVTLAVVSRENRPEILLNLSSSRQEGRDFDANFLKICTVIRTNCAACHRETPAPEESNATCER